MIGLTVYLVQDTCVGALNAQRERERKKGITFIADILKSKLL